MARKLLLAIETLLPGGAELFVLRLAEAMTNHFEVHVLVLYADKIDVSLKNRYQHLLHFRPITFRGDRTLRKIDSILTKFDIPFQFRDRIVARQIRKILTEGFAVIHSNLFKVDYVCCLANTDQRIPHFITIHGDYLNFHERAQSGKSLIPKFNVRANFVLSRVKGIACISDQQIKFLQDHFQIAACQTKISKIYNGVHVGPVSPAKFILGEKKFVFGMIARGISQKGWESAISAFLKLARPNTILVLVGHSEYLNGLKKKYTAPNIVFAGATTDPFSWIAHFNVGLLPSTFASESLPTAVIEYLLMGKPVIATNVGEIYNMLNTNKVSAGFTIPVIGAKPDEDALTKAMATLHDNAAVYQTFVAGAIYNSKKFDMQVCVTKYLNFYSV